MPARRWKYFFFKGGFFGGFFLKYILCTSVSNNKIGKPLPFVTFLHIGSFHASSLHLSSCWFLPCLNLLVSYLLYLPLLMCVSFTFDQSLSLSLCLCTNLLHCQIFVHCLWSLHLFCLTVTLSSAPTCVYTTLNVSLSPTVFLCLFVFPAPAFPSVSLHWLFPSVSQ